jgi:AP-3 complex subunit beta
LSPSLADLANISASSIPIASAQTHVSKKEYELLSKINGNGLQISYRFTRAPNKFSPKAVTIELKLSNFSNGDFSGFHVANKKLQSGMSMSDLAEFDLPKGE